MSYKYSELITEFRSIHRDASTLTNKLFSDTEILRWACDANMELMNETGLLQDRADLPITSGNAEYSFPTNVLKVTQILDDDSERIWPTTIDVLEQHSNTWRSESGTVRYYYPLEGFMTGKSYKDIGFYKKPDESQILKVYFWKLPKHQGLNAANDSPEIEDNLLKLLMPYILAQGFAKRRDFTERDKQLTVYWPQSIKKAKKFIYGEEDALLVMGSNESTVGPRSIWRLPDGYPEIR